MVLKKRKYLGKNQIFQTKFFNENIYHGDNDNQDREIKIFWINYTKYGKYNIDIIRKPNQKIFGQRIYQDR